MVVGHAGSLLFVCLYKFADLYHFCDCSHFYPIQIPCVTFIEKILFFVAKYNLKNYKCFKLLKIFIKYYYVGYLLICQSQSNLYFRDNIVLKHYRLRHTKSKQKCMINISTVIVPFSTRNLHTSEEIAYKESLTKFFWKNKAVSNPSEKISLEECYNKDWIITLNDSDKIDDYICEVCHNVARNAMELTCDSHEDMQKSLIVGEECLKHYLEQNDNKCPVGNHVNCEYSKMKLVRQYVNDLLVVCPRQYELSVQTGIKTTGTEGSELPMGVNCNFRGRLKDVADHLDQSCEFKTVDCPFHQYGCQGSFYQHSCQAHLQEQVEYHLNLVVDTTKTLQDQLSQSESSVHILQ
ncbi:hypothetical protein RFI_16752, partial [Reticulomyxa filosa]